MYLQSMLDFSVVTKVLHLPGAGAGGRFRVSRVFIYVLAEHAGLRRRHPNTTSSTRGLQCPASPNLCCWQGANECRPRLSRLGVCMTHPSSRT